jgi:hypothetical protein
VLDYCLLSRGIYELRYQLLNHPERSEIPIKALLHLLHERDRRQPEPGQDQPETAPAPQPPLLIADAAK